MLRGGFEKILEDLCAEKYMEGGFLDSTKGRTFLENHKGRRKVEKILR